VIHITSLLLKLGIKSLTGYNLFMPSFMLGFSKVENVLSVYFGIFAIEIKFREDESN
jgi:hypothetical protein